MRRSMVLVSVAVVAVLAAAGMLSVSRSAASSLPTSTTPTTATRPTTTTPAKTTPAKPSPTKPTAKPVKRTTTPTSTTETVTVAGASRAPAIPASFLGLSIEYQSAAADAGPSNDPNPLLDRLVQALNPGQRPVIRIGGDSTDHSWYPVAGDDEPGLSYALTPAWISSVATLATATNAQLILGINLEMNNPKLAAAEADALAGGIPRANLLAWEVGNEPSLYASFPWYTKVANDASTGVFTRSKGYSFSQYLKQYNATAAVLPKLALAGPALGTSPWMNDVPTMLKADKTVADVTYHAYPLNCFARPGDPAYPSIADLLAPTASVGLADSLSGYVRAAAAAHRAFRVDELNSDACGGAVGVSNTFASALWATDTLFQMAAQGVSGVNIQTFDGSRYKPFAFSVVNGVWSAQVEPLYYGLILFSQAAPAGSQLLNTTSTGASTVRAYAAQTPGHAGPETVTLLNDSTTQTTTVTVRAPHTDGGSLGQMLAPSAAATSGVTIGGQTYGASTTTARLTGASTAQRIRPVAPGLYRVTLGPASATLLSLQH